MGFWGGVKDFFFGDRFDEREQWKSDPANAKLGGGDQMRGMAERGWSDAWDREAPQMGGHSSFRGGQEGLISQLQGVASGEQRGAGEMAMDRQRQAGLAQQIAMRNMARGSNAASAARAAASNAGQMSTNYAGMASQAALQDQTAARGLLGQVLGQARGQDQSYANANMNAKLQTMGMNDAARQAYLQQMFGMSQAEMNARLMQEQMDMNSSLNQPRDNGMFGDLLQMGGTLGAAYLGRPGGGK